MTGLNIDFQLEIICEHGTLETFSHVTDHDGRSTWMAEQGADGSSDSWIETDDAGLSRGRLRHRVTCPLCNQTAEARADRMDVKLDEVRAECEHYGVFWYQLSALAVVT